MTGQLGDGSWGVQQLAGFLGALAAAADTEDMVTGAAHRIAEALDAEVCALISDDAIEAVVGFPAAAVPTEPIRRVAREESDELDVPGVGRIRAVVIDAQLGVSRSVVVGRLGEPLDASERHLVRAMTQVLELTLQLRGTAERERRLRRAVERQTEELQQVNDQLVRAVQVKRDLVAMASHELRTPLAAVIGFTRLLKDGWEDFADDDRDQYLDILDRHGRRMLRLVDDLLTVGTLEDDRLTPRPQRMSLSDGVAQALHGLTGADVDLVPARDDDVRVDPDHLSQIVLNLVENATKYGEPPVEVRVEVDGAVACLEVVDAGPGVPKSFVPSLFERFTQASTGLRREGSGVGLGLAIVAGLAERNGGSVDYTREDGRTRFAVRFPRATG